MAGFAATPGVIDGAADHADMSFGRAPTLLSRDRIASTRSNRPNGRTRDIAAAATTRATSCGDAGCPDHSTWPGGTDCRCETDGSCSTD
jgi:hypothetical protein